MRRTQFIYRTALGVESAAGRYSGKKSCIIFEEPFQTLRIVPRYDMNRIGDVESVLAFSRRQKIESIANGAIDDRARED
jgi:hypothetical protein